MSDTGRLPTSSDSQTIGAKAEKCFGANSPESWRPINVGGTGDFGIDYQVQTFEGNQATDMFRVQLKGTTVPALNAEGTHFSIQLKASTIRYYARFTESILLILCDLSANAMAIKCPLYYVWIHDEIRRINAQDLPDERLFVSLRVPKANILDGDTDLSADLSQFRALAKIGASLDMTLERRAPSLDSGSRAALLEKLPGGFSARGAALMESLAEEPITVWPDRPTGSMVWLLFETERHLNSGAFDKAGELLAFAAEKLNLAVSLEVAEYWHLQGRLHLMNMSQEDACEAFKKAIVAEPDHPKYAAAWAETRLSIDFSIDGTNDFSDIYSVLTSSAPAVLSIKARALAAERRHAEAFEILDTFSGSEQLSAKAIIHTMRSESREALKVCESGLSLPGVRDATRLLFVILKARAQFNVAVGMTANAANDGIRMPLTGTPDMDLGLLAESWNGMKTAMEGLRAAGWPSNIEFAADLLCAMASILGKEDEALSMLSDAASNRPTLPTLQASVESLAAQTGDFALAMQANALQPQMSTTKLRKASLLHMAKKDAECVSFFETHLPSFDQADPMFGETLALAITSADRLVKVDLARAWLAIFDSRPELAPRRAIWDYFFAVSKNRAKRAQALDALLRSFDTHARPLSIAVHLFYALNASIPEEAEKLIPAAEVLMRDRLFPLDGILQFGQALTTLERWPELLALVEDAQKRFCDDKMLAAVKSLALDRLGRTAEARDLLSPIIAQGVTEPFILYTHIDIATRCGFLEEAITAVEMLVSSATDPEKKIQHLRVLHNLIRAKNPSDSRAHDIAWRIGELTDQGSEMNEGAFLLMLMTSRARGDGDGARIAEFQERLKVYNANFPHSPILRSATIPENATPDELLPTLMKLVGDTPEQFEARRARENLFHNGQKHIPFAWRPRTFIGEVRDLPQLWAMAKEAQGSDQKLLLTMAFGDWKALTWDDMRGRIPLMDFVALLVAHDLGILEPMFKLFPKIAVSQEVLIDLGKLVDPLTGSIAREKCFAIQSTLQAKFEQVLQPRANKSEMSDASVVARGSEEMKALSRQPPYLMYSDDLFFRIFCREQDEDFQSICTLDVLSALESQGLLTTAEVAEKIGQLCSWGVGLAIEHRWQLASLPSGLNEVPNVAAGVEMLQRSPSCISIFNGMWDRPNIPYQDLQAHAGQLLSSMLGDESRSTTSIASLMAIWRSKTMRLPDAPPDDLTGVALLARHAILVQADVTVPFCTRLWKVYLLLAAHEQEKPLDEEGLVEAASMIAFVAANSDLSFGLFNRKSFRVTFEKGIRDGTLEHLVFKMGYKSWRKSIAERMGLSAPTFTHPGKAAIEGPNYRQRWKNGYRLALIGT